MFLKATKSISLGLLFVGQLRAEPSNHRVCIPPPDRSERWIDDLDVMPWAGVPLTHQAHAIIGALGSWEIGNSTFRVSAWVNSGCSSPNFLFHHSICAEFYSGALQNLRTNSTVSPEDPSCSCCSTSRTPPALDQRRYFAWWTIYGFRGPVLVPPLHGSPGWKP